MLCVLAAVTNTPCPARSRLIEAGEPHRADVEGLSVLVVGIVRVASCGGVISRQHVGAAFPSNLQWHRRCGCGCVAKHLII